MSKIRDVPKKPEFPFLWERWKRKGLLEVDIHPANTAFIDVVHQACQALGRTEVPAKSVAILPEADGAFSLKLIDITLSNPQNIFIIFKATARDIDSVTAALCELFPFGNKGDELAFLNEKLDRPNVNAHRWILVNPITMMGAEVGGRVPQSEYNNLITD